MAKTPALAAGVFFCVDSKQIVVQSRKMKTGSKTVLITGANRGIGAAMEKAFLSNDWQVISCMRTPTSPPKDTTNLQPSLTQLELDITNQAQIDNVYQYVKEKDLKLDVLINNAGIFPEPTDMSFRQLDLAWFEEAMGVNFLGTIRITQKLLPLMSKNQNPCIVNLSSGASSITQRSGRRYCYGASKAALNHLTRGLAIELKPEGIIVVALSPGWVKTDMGGNDADLAPENVGISIEKTIRSLTLQQTGEFLDRLGNTETYAW